MLMHNDPDKTPIFLHPRAKQQMFQVGADLFNDEKYFEAHEEWETLWLKESGAEKTVLQGLIQAAGHFVHLQKGRWSAATSLAKLALEKMETPLPNQSVYAKFDMEPVFNALTYNLETANDRDAEPQPESFLYPKLFTL